MTAYRLFGLLGFVLGFMLYLSLLSALLQRRIRAGGEKVLICLFVALSLWLLGNSLTFFCELLFSPRSAAEVSGWPFFKIFDLISGLGMLAAPPLLVHAFVAPLRAPAGRGAQPEAALPFRRLRASLLALLADCALAIFYLPMIFFLPSIIFLFYPTGAWLLTHRAGVFAGAEKIFEIANSETTFVAKDLRYLMPYLCYLLAASAACTLFARLTIPRRRRREDKLFFRTFYRAFWLMNAAMAIIISACAVLAFAMPGTYVEPSTGKALKVFSLMAAIGPGVILAVYAYRYNYMSLNLWKKPLYVGAALLAAAVSLQGFNAAGGWIEHVLRVNLVIVEVASVALIVALLAPARNLVRRLVSRVIARQEDLHRRRLVEISEQLNAPSIFTLSQMFDFVAAGIRQAFDISRVVLLAYRRAAVQGPRPAVHASNMRAENIDTGTILSFLGGGRRKYVDLLASRNPQLIDEMRALRCQMVFPLARGGQILGLLAIGRSSLGAFSPGEIEMLSIFAGHVATAVENLMLVDDKVNLRQKMLESEKLLSLGRLSASVAHEVKNPLSAIKTITQVVQEDLPPDSPIQGDLAMICSEIDRLNNVVNRLLEFARPSRTPEVAVDMGDVVDSVVTVLRHEAARKKVQIDLDIDPDLPPMRLNVEALKEILFNLVLNAVQAIDGAGRVGVTARIIREGDEEPMLQIVVADTGPGVPEEDIERIFEPFYTTKAIGTGLGLAIVRQKVTDLGGGINVLNDNGARFTMRIPFVSVAPLKSERTGRTSDRAPVRK